jgi:hypothetical protein
MINGILQIFVLLLLIDDMERKQLPMWNLMIKRTSHLGYTNLVLWEIKRRPIILKLTLDWHSG